MMGRARGHAGAGREGRGWGLGGQEFSYRWWAGGMYDVEVRERSDRPV